MTTTSTLFEAVQKGEAETAASLLAAGADVNARDEHGWTPLCWAAGKGDAPLVSLLLERGADPTLTGRDLRTPLMIAKAAGRADVAGVLTRIEQERGVWTDPRETRPYCRAYYVRDLAPFPGWAAARALDERSRDGETPPALGDDDVVFVHQDFTVTRSIWRDEQVLLTPTPEWRAYCEHTLAFQIPEDLL
jgi:hypothetical protein